MTTDNLEAALQELEVERRKREDLRIEAGEAIRLPLHVVVPPGMEAAETAKLIEQAKAHNVAALRAGGNRREVCFEEPELIIIGVPRACTPADWKPESNTGDCAYRPTKAGENSPSPEASPAATATEPAAPAVSKPAPLEWKPIQTQVSPPDERSCGVVIGGARAVDGNQLHVRDHEGRSWRVAFRPGDDPDVLARKLLREKFGKHHAFNQPIRYPRRSYH